MLKPRDTSEVKLTWAQWEPCYLHETATKTQCVSLAEPSLLLEQAEGLRGLSKAHQSRLTELVGLDIESPQGSVTDLPESTQPRN